jgi:hypothetical protein
MFKRIPLHNCSTHTYIYIHAQEHTVRVTHTNMHARAQAHRHTHALMHNYFTGSLNLFISFPFCLIKEFFKKFFHTGDTNYKCWFLPNTTCILLIKLKNDTFLGTFSWFAVLIPIIDRSIPTFRKSPVLKLKDLFRVYFLSF